MPAKHSKHTVYSPTLAVKKGDLPIQPCPEVKDYSLGNVYFLGLVHLPRKESAAEKKRQDQKDDKCDKIHRRTACRPVKIKRARRKGEGNNCQ